MLPSPKEAIADLLLKHLLLCWWSSLVQGKEAELTLQVFVGIYIALSACMAVFDCCL